MSSKTSEKEAQIALEASLVGENANKLADELLAKRGASLTLNAKAVDRVDTPCIEVLIAAAQLWQKDNQQFSVLELSEQFENALTILGIEPSILEHGAT